MGSKHKFLFSINPEKNPNKGCYTYWHKRKSHTDFITVKDDDTISNFVTQYD